MVLLPPTLVGNGPPMLPAVCVPGKLRSRPPVVTAVVGEIHPLYSWDRRSGRRFLLDTGVEVSVLPPSGADTRAGKSTVSWPIWT